MAAVRTPTFQEFLARFESVSLPISLSPDSAQHFTGSDRTLHPEMIEHWLGYLQGDEYTEIIPCLQIADAEHFISVVVWKADLLNYSFHLVHYTLKGERIADQLLAGISTDGATMMQRVATIDRDWTIQLAEGLSLTEEQLNPELASLEYDPETTRRYSLEVLETGDILDVTE